jgi:hypothetical protein
MSYRDATFGRTHHLHYLDIDFDTDSLSYGQSAGVTRYDTTVDDDEALVGQGGIGTWRLPHLAEECAEVLWRFWYIPGPPPLSESRLDKGKQRQEEPEEDDEPGRLADDMKDYMQGVWCRSVE